VSPYFFSESVMVKVATGKAPTKDADFCEKYKAAWEPRRAPGGGPSLASVGRLLAYFSDEHRQLASRPASSGLDARTAE